MGSYGVPWRTSPSLVHVTPSFGTGWFCLFGRVVHLWIGARRGFALVVRGAVCSSYLDPRIDESVQDIRDQICCHHAERDEHSDSHDRREVEG